MKEPEKSPDVLTSGNERRSADRSGFWRFWLPLAVILFVAAWLRFHRLDSRPMHADEANQAVKLGALLEKGEYAFDPRDHHGPTLYYFGLIPAWFRGERTLAQLTEATVRSTPAAFGVIAVGLLAMAALPAGRVVSLLAAVFLAISPAAVYYSRYYIQETLLVTFALGAFVAAQRWRDTRGWLWALFAGVGIGLMQSTKASTPVFVIAAMVAWAMAGGLSPSRGEWRPRAAGVAWATLGFFGTVVLFYSSFFTHPSGLYDAWSTYGVMSGRVAAQAGGHEKPWWYYLELFWRQRHGGYRWDQSLFLGLSVVGITAAIARRNAWMRGVAWYALLVGVALAIPPYKTPWVVVNLIPAMAVLSAGALIWVSTWKPWMRVPVSSVFVAAVIWQGWQVRQVVFLRPADPRNPFAYVHSGPDVLKVEELANRVASEPIKVISEEYWPLPWYLRKHPAVGYWTEVPADCDAALVIASVGFADNVRARLKATYLESYLGLRPGFVLVVFTKQ